MDDLEVGDVNCAVPMQTDSLAPFALRVFMDMAEESVARCENVFTSAIGSEFDVSCDDSIQDALMLCSNICCGQKPV